MVEPEKPQMAIKYGACELHTEKSKATRTQAHAHAHAPGYTRLRAQPRTRALEEARAYAHMNPRAHTHTHTHSEYTIIITFPRNNGLIVKLYIAFLLIFWQHVSINLIIFRLIPKIKN
jgi:hypothetical protein